MSTWKLFFIFTLVLSLKEWSIPWLDTALNGVIEQNGKFPVLSSSQ